MLAIIRHESEVVGKSRRRSVTSSMKAAKSSSAISDQLPAKLKIRSARLWGAADSIREASHNPVTPSEQVLLLREIRDFLKARS